MIGAPYDTLQRIFAAKTVRQINAKGKVMGVFNTIARNHFVRLSFLLFLMSLTVPLRPVLAQSQKPAVEEKKRQTNDIAVTVVVSGLSCTCARFAEDIRNVVNDLRPDGVQGDFKT